MIRKADEHREAASGVFARLESPLKQIAAAAGVSITTAHRWTNGQTQPSFDQTAALIDNLDRPDAERIIRRLLPAGVALSWPEDQDDRELDLNGDGRVDLKDAELAQIEADVAASEMVRFGFEVAADGRVDDEEVMESNRRAGALTRLVRTASRIRERVSTERRPARRSA